jgi:hypothetical protein
MTERATIKSTIPARGVAPIESDALGTTFPTRFRSKIAPTARKREKRDAKEMFWERMKTDG